MKYNFIKKAFPIFLFVSVTSFSFSQDYWQQQVVYNMTIDFDVDRNQFSGEQKLKYFNNSPDTLTKVFYHL
ncbi:MAG: M1 family peptidase, partial [Bacteroidota bacterium]